MNLYTKYSNQRDIIHNIRTGIVKKSDGSLVVVKQPDTEAAKEHVLNMPLFAKKLEEKCVQNNLNMRPASVCQNGDSVEMEFVEGKTLYNVLNECIKNNDIEQFNRLIKQYAEYVNKMYAVRPFKKSERFVEVFGDVDLPEGLMAGDFADIDLIFTNIIVGDDGKWNVIDYEWSFDFDIPIDFVLWRAALYSHFYDKFSVDLFRRFGISEGQYKIFEQIEIYFQNVYLNNTTTGLGFLYQDMGMDSVPLGKLMDDQNKRLLLKAAQIFVDYGNGFSEENSFWLDAEQKEDYYCLTINNIPKDAKKLRIDPAQVDCAIEFLRIEASLSDGEKIEVPYITNGIDLGDNCYVFKDNDTIIYIDYDASKVNSIQICYRAVSLASFEKFSVCLPKQIENFSNAKNNEIAAKDADLAAKDAAIVQLQKELASIKGSRSWRFTKPLRAFGAWARKVKIIKWPVKFLLSLKRVGLKETFKKVNRKIRNKLGIKNKRKKININERIRNLSKKEKTFFRIYPNAANQIINLGAYRNIFEKISNQISGDVKFSILVPLYNTDRQMLKEMIESVLIQSYNNFELCLADGSDNKHSYVEKICCEYAKKDKRVVYKKLEKNLGISGNTNACLEMATGEYISLFDHDDFLHPLALEKTYNEVQTGADFVYTDECTFSQVINHIITTNYKSDYSLDALLSNNYICHFTSFKKDLLYVCGGCFKTKYDGAQDHDLILRLTDKAKKISHIKECLYFWRSHPGSTAQNIDTKSYACEAGCKAVRDFLINKNINAKVSSTNFCPTVYRVSYEIYGEPMVSIIISNKDRASNLKKCIDSVLQKSTYKNFEIIVVENDSKEEYDFSYYKELETNERFRIVTWKKDSSYSAINNFGVSFAKGDYYILLSSVTEIIEPSWIEELLMYAQRKDIGAVGSKLLYADNTVCHAGVIIGFGSFLAGYPFLHCDRNDPCYGFKACSVQNVSAVTGACIMLRKDVWQEVKGMNDKFNIILNDIDLCMKVRKAGYSIVYNPFSLLYYHGNQLQPSKFILGADKDIVLFSTLWKNELDKGDPYYNPNFSMEMAYVLLPEKITEKTY